MRYTRAKICCISSIAEAQMAVAYGADALGLVSSMPSGPGVISEEQIIEIAATVPPGVSTFLLTSAQDVNEIIAQQRRCRTDTVQIVDRLTVGTHAELREALPGVGIVQVIHVQDASSIAEAVALAPQVDAILLDSGNQKLAVKELGGTGRTHDWSLSRRIREAIAPTPLYLAGGLRPENAADAIATVEPFGLDICSGVRTNDRLDEQKLARYMAVVRG